MRVLWIATKAPSPAIDGGRLVMRSTIDALVAAGADVTLVAPRADQGAGDPADDRMILVESRRCGWGEAGWRSIRSGRPITVERHANPAVATRVASLVRHQTFDVVHVEQLQALGGASAARAAGIACVLRAHNVESLIWQNSAPRSGLRAILMRAEARRLRRFETTALAQVETTIALSTTDAARLSALNPAARVVAIPPPAPHVTAGRRLQRGTLDGEPAFTWIGSAGWPPNEDAVAWLMSAVWPALSSRLPAARLHVFVPSTQLRAGPSTWLRAGGPSGPDPTVTYHAAPRDSSEAFVDGTILLLPLRIAAGVRMRLLEAWAVGVPAIASPAAVDGLETADGIDVLLAGDPRGFADAAARLATDPDLRSRLVRGGRATLARRHDPAAVAQAMLGVYRDAIERGKGGSIR